MTLCRLGKPANIVKLPALVERDVKAVHGDITALLEAGVIDKTTDGQIEFAFDAVKVEFLLQAA